MKETNRRFAERIKSLRAAKGLSQQDLADLLGVSQSAVGLWEAGMRSAPRGNNLLKLCEVFGLSPVDFMGQAQAASPLSDEELKLLAMYRGLPTQMRALAVKLLGVIAT